MLHQIGVGALGPVFRTYEPEHDRLVAVKVFRLDITPEQAQALADELARAADASLFHPSIVEPIAAGVQGTVAYRAEEYMPAESLDIAMRHYAPAPLERVLPIVTQLAGAIDFARASGIGHGGLHPRDVFVTPEEARVTGFGVVEALERVGLRAPVRRPYSPPERIAGESWSTPADVFALAAITFELLTGRRPAGTGSAIGELTESGAGPHAARVLAVLQKAMSDRPGDRYGTALAFASALEAASRGEGEPAVVATPVSATEETREAPLAASVEAAAQFEEEAEQEQVAPIAARADRTETPASAPVASEATSNADRDVPLAAAEPRSKRRKPAARRQPIDVVPPAFAARETPSSEPADDVAFRDAEEHVESAGLAATVASASASEGTAQPDPFLLDTADLVLDEGMGRSDRAEGLEGALFADESASRDEPVLQPRETRNDDSAATAAAFAAPRVVAPPPVAPSHAASMPTSRADTAPPPLSRAADDSYTYDRPLAIEQSAETRAVVVPQRRTAMLPLAIALLIGLPLAYAVGYMRGRAVAGSEAPPPTTVAEAGTAGAGTPYSEQAIEPSAAPTPASGTQDVPVDAKPEAASTRPAANVPTTGRIVVRSTPSRAAVTVNGKWSGRTPLTLTGLAFGDYVVRVVQEGYRVGREEFTLDAEHASRTIEMRLEREAARTTPAPARAAPAGSRSPTVYYGSLYVDSRPQGATVYVGGERRGTTPLRIAQIPVGSYVVRLELIDHSAWTKVVQVTAGQEARATGSLDPIR